MKALAFWSITAGLVAGLAMYEVSALRTPGISDEAAKKVASTTQKLPTPAVRPHVTTPSLPPAAPTRTREEQSQQLQLEIGRALASADDAERERAYTQLLAQLIAID